MKRWLAGIVAVLLQWERDDETNSARSRQRYGRWARIMRRKHETGRGVIRVDREGVAYMPAKRVVLRAK